MLPDFMKSRVEAFEKRSGELAAEISDLEHKSIVLSVIRFISFLLIIVAGVFGYLQNSLMLYIASGLIFCGFIILCVVHSKVTKTLRYRTSLFTVNSQYIYRISGDYDGLLQTDIKDFKKLEDINLNTAIHNGDDFYVRDHDYCQDLGIFGKRSVFALINTCETYMGRKRLAHKLLNSSVEENKEAGIPMLQEACAELAGNVDFMQSLQAQNRLGYIKYSDDDLRNLFAGFKPLNGFLQILYKIMPALWLIPVVFLFVLPQFVKAAVLGVIALNILVWGICLYKHFMLPSGNTIRKIKTVAGCYSLLETQEFKSEYLNKLIKCDIKGGKKVSDVMGGLIWILNIADLRSQPLFAFILNAVCPLDLFLTDMLGIWNRANGSYLSRILDNVGEIESLTSLAQITITADEYVFPTFIDSNDPNDNAFFDGVNICHPLLYPETRVANSVCLNSDIALITGSNMSGKTTLIRTVGICSLLAYMGGPVPAKSLTLGKMRIMTSMRIVDSLEESMSTFKAELVRISSIVEAGREGIPLLFLIDEIFRGTNSDDRTDGAYTVLNNLSKKYICGMMTTHDYALVDKTQNALDSIVFYHFSETYSDSSIHFDYKLTSGISRSSNAKFLMKLVGIDRGE